MANRQAHIDGTGPEIWAQTGGAIDAFICAVGTGGTLAGVAAALREKKPDIAIGLADPGGASLYEYYAHGELKAVGTSVTEGIGQSPDHRQPRGPDHRLSLSRSPTRR